MSRVEGAPYARLERHLAELTDYEREARVRYDRTTFDLDRMERLMERLGRPERAYRVAHVTGTKGKGSTATLIASCLSRAGLRTGLYTSPHLRRLGERIAIEGRASTEEELGASFAAIEPGIEALRAEGERFTFFEVTTALAFERFRREGVEAAAVEVGLGGRLDSTNVVRPAVTAITSVGLDHTDKLGGTHAEIAREKAGILKPGVPAILGRLPPEAEAVVREVARSRGAPIRSLPQDLGADRVAVSESGTEADLRLPGGRLIERARLALVGRHMAENAAVAAAAALVLVEGAGGAGVLTEQALREGLLAARIDGRFQIFRGRPTLVVDGAHNPDSMAVLGQALSDVYPGARPVLVFGVMRDKDVRSMLRLAAGFASALVAAPCGSARETPPGELAAIAKELGIAAEASPGVAGAIARARELAGAGGLVVVCGSLYLAGAALQELERDPA